MTRHLARLLWNRRRQNGLVVAEMLIAFLVLFAVVTLGLQSWSSARTALGFEWRDRWLVTLDPPDGTRWSKKEAALLKRLADTLRGMPEVAGVALANPAPYSDSNRISAYTREGRNVEFRSADGSDELARVLGLDVVAGRWFSAEDDGLPSDAVVITRSLAEELWPGQDPLGRNLSPDQDREGKPMRPRRVVGVLSGFRQDGELMWPAHYVFERSVATRRRSRHVLVHVRPGTSSASEQKLVRALEAAAPGWSVRLRPLEEMRAEKLRSGLAPLVAVAIVAAFLMLMVFLGLSGVLWQAVTQRTREIGLRRAKGASAAAVQWQLMAEIALLTTVAVGVGLLLLVQLPWLDLVGGVSRGVYVASLATTAGAIYVLTLACGLYPGRLAAKLSPAEALHYE